MLSLCFHFESGFRKLAAIKKEEGNMLYTSQDYTGAVGLYSEAIGN